MTPRGVRDSLLQDEDADKVLSLNDGRRIVVKGRERWLAAPDKLIVLDPRGRTLHIAYHNIATITFGKTNGRRGA